MKHILVGLLAVVMLSGCVTIKGELVRGSGKVVTEERNVSGFQKIDISGSGEAVIVQGSEEGLSIEMEENLLPYMKSEVVNGVLQIGFKQEGVLNSFQPTKPIKFHIRVKDLSAVQSSGAVNVNMASLETKDLSINISGAGKVAMDQLTAETMKVNLSGATELDLSGKVTNQSVDLSGSSKYNAGSLESDVVDLSASGSSKVTVWAHEELKLNLSGSSDISYYGTPALTQDVSGSADIESLGEK